MLNEYPVEVLDGDVDNGTMPESLDNLKAAVVGRRIVNAERQEMKGDYFRSGNPLVLTLDDGTKVALRETSDCCAYTEVEEFVLNANAIDHIITGVGTTDGYDTWHIYADLGDVLTMKVVWSAGNPFYYGYGLDIQVIPTEA